MASRRTPSGSSRAAQQLRPRSTSVTSVRQLRATAGLRAPRTVGPTSAAEPSRMRRSLDDVDPDRIMVFGFSLSSGTTVQLAAAVHGIRRHRCASTPSSTVVHQVLGAGAPQPSRRGPGRARRGAPRGPGRPSMIQSTGPADPAPGHHIAQRGRRVAAAADAGLTVAQRGLAASVCNGAAPPPGPAGQPG